jgi:hypothetical protein
VLLFLFSPDLAVGLRPLFDFFRQLALGAPETTSVAIASVSPASLMLVRDKVLLKT